MSISLHSFCKENSLPKSSVHRRCQELGIDTTGGLNQVDCDRLLAEFGKTPTAIKEPKDVTAMSGAIIPVVRTVEAIPVSTDLVARKIQPQVISYDTSDLDAATQLNEESLEFNINAMGTQLIEQMKQIGRLHAAQARQAYAHTIATELGMGKSQDTDTAGYSS
jgi:hypothetical protein